MASISKVALSLPIHAIYDQLFCIMVHSDLIPPIEVLQKAQKITNTLPSLLNSLRAISPIRTYKVINKTGFL